MRTYFGFINERLYMIHSIFLSFYQDTGLLEQAAMVGLGQASMELVLTMVQDLEVTGLVQVVMVLDLGDMEARQQAEVEALVVVLGV